MDGLSSRPGAVSEWWCWNCGFQAAEWQSRRRSGGARHRGKHAIDHLGRHAEIVGRVGQALDRGTVEVAGHQLVPGKNLGKRAALLIDRAAGGIDDIVRLLTADMRRQVHHHRLGDDQPLADVEVPGHLLVVDDEAAEGELGLVERSRRQHEALGDRHPFGMPGTGRPLEVLDHGVEHQAGMLAHPLRGGEHQLGRDRIALLRHGRGCAASLHEGLVNLGELGRGHDHDVERDLAERARDQSEQVDGFGEPIAGDVPG